jgi:twitching motility protein PilT
MVSIMEIMENAVHAYASDIHLTVGIPPAFRINGNLEYYGKTILTDNDTKNYINQILDEYQIKQLDTHGQVDVPFFLPGIARFRINAYKQRGYYALAIRIICINPPTLDELGFPECLKELAMKSRGLVLVTGPAGSGKSTTLAAMISYINQNKNCHIITLEEPIEYLHDHNRSIINQREIGSDCKTFSEALRAALREDPDVIMVGEMRDLETIATAITAAETGHLVMSTLHTITADQTIDRIIDSFPAHQQSQIKIQLAGVLEGIISQQLLPMKNVQRRKAAMEILLVNNAVRNLIREGRTHQIQTSIQTGIKAGMRPMDYSLAELVQRNLVSYETAFARAVNKELFQQYMKTN